MTDKLYYKDAYMSEFCAKVLFCEQRAHGYLVVLDRTAFFPTEGGQYADTGIIDGMEVLDVIHNGERIYHLVSGPIEVGKQVKCKLNFANRFEKMQCHTAEHIISGIIYKMYGFQNVGFHLGADEVTLDIDGVLTRDMLDAVEDEANEAVYKNIPVKAYFPDPKELSLIDYRSKLDLTEDVRIVSILGVDTCACCAPHVSSTGEIGVIKLLNVEKHKGGVRIYMLAGWRALHDYRAKHKSTYEISGLLSTPQSDVLDAVRGLNLENERLKFALKQKGLRFSRLEAEALCATEGNYVAYYPDMNMEELRNFAKYAGGKVSGILVSVTGVEGDYKYVITSATVNLSERVKDINTSLSGRGGGRADMIQGSFNAKLSEIREYFEK